MNRMKHNILFTKFLRLNANKTKKTFDSNEFEWKPVWNSTFLFQISKTISLYLLIATAINIVRTDDDDDDNDDKVILHSKWKRLVMPLQMVI